MARSAVSSSRANRSGSRSASAGSTRAAAAGITSRMWLSALADPHAGPGYSQAAASWGRMHPRLHAPRIPSSSAHCSSASVTCAGDGVGTRYAVCYLGPREQPSRRGRCTYHVFTRLGHGVSVDAGARQETGTKSSCRASQAGGARCGRAARRSAARRGRMQGRGGRAKQALKQAAHNSCILARAAYTSCGAGRQLGGQRTAGRRAAPATPGSQAGRPPCLPCHMHGWQRPASAPQQAQQAQQAHLHRRPHAGPEAHLAAQHPHVLKLGAAEWQGSRNQAWFVGSGVYGGMQAPGPPLQPDRRARRSVGGSGRQWGAARRRRTRLENSLVVSSPQAALSRFR